jgi:hypothetical protein
MSAQKKGDEDPTYDRQLLLGGAKRNAVLELWEVKRYGIDSYGDADYVSIYGSSTGKAETITIATSSNQAPRVRGCGPPPTQSPRPMTARSSDTPRLNVMAARRPPSL